MGNHTPTPWELDDDGPTVYLYAKIDKDNWLRGSVAYTTNFGWDAPHLANAEFILKAVNNHYALVEALKAVAAAKMPGEARRIAVEALRSVAPPGRTAGGGVMEPCTHTRPQGNTP